MWSKGKFTKWKCFWNDFYHFKPKLFKLFQVCICMCVCTCECGKDQRHAGGWHDHSSATCWHGSTSCAVCVCVWDMFDRKWTGSQESDCWNRENKQRLYLDVGCRTGEHKAQLCSILCLTRRVALEQLLGGGSLHLTLDLFTSSNRRTAKVAKK